MDGMALRVHPVFFKEFASKTWTSAGGVVAELVENSFDEDATRVLVTLTSDGCIAVEDDAGMDEVALGRFLVVGSPHKQEERRSPRFGRQRSGRYGLGRLSFLTAFRRMLVKTRRGSFHSAFELDERVLEGLASGEAPLRRVDEPPLGRDGTEIRLLEPRVKVEYKRLMQELRRLECLKQPFFELYLKSSQKLMEWSFIGAERVLPPGIDGLRIPVSGPGLEGEVIVSRRPLPEEERGLAVMVGGHSVCRSTFNVSGAAAERITGWVRGEGLTARFADKSALIEDEAYEEFHSRVKNFLKERVIPAMNECIEAEITRGELSVYRQVDRLLAEAIHHVIEFNEGLEGSSEASEAGGAGRDDHLDGPASDIASLYMDADVNAIGQDEPFNGSFLTVPKSLGAKAEETALNPEDEGSYKHTHGNYGSPATSEETSHGTSCTTLNSLGSGLMLTVAKPSMDGHGRRGCPLKAVEGGPVRRTFRLKRIGYRVVPFEDERDDREAFADGEFIYVNKAHPVYRVEAEKGGELLLRHVIRLVSKVIALNYHPEGVEALDLQNKLIAEAIRLRRGRSSRGTASPQVFTPQL
ncbi:MAG: ATP-binding protein [Candidatus Bathyarchaeia archaeon]